MNGEITDDMGEAGVEDDSAPSADKGRLTCSPSNSLPPDDVDAAPPGSDCNGTTTDKSQLSVRRKSSPISQEHTQSAFTTSKCSPTSANTELRLRPRRPNAAM